MNLSGAGGGLAGGTTLGAHLGDLADGLALGGTGALGLVGLLGGGGGGLLVLGLLDGGEAGGGAGLGAHAPALLDHLERGADDATLRLDGAAGALLGHLLGDALAVLAAEQDGPGDAAGVLSLQEQRLGLAVLEAEDLAVAADKDLTLFGENHG